MERAGAVGRAEDRTCSVPGNTLVLKAAEDASLGVLLMDRAHGRSGRSGHLAWLLSNSVITAPIVGATKLSQLDEAIASVELKLSDEEITSLQAPYVPHAVVGFTRSIWPFDMARCRCILNQKPAERGTRTDAMAKMTVMVVPEPGSALRKEEHELPEPGRHDVRIRVQAYGVCHSDAATVQGLFPDISDPRVPGGDR
jgi:hypothetical protein